MKGDKVQSDETGFSAELIDPTLSNWQESLSRRIRKDYE